MNLEFESSNYLFTARASAIIFNKDKTKILLFKVKDDRDYFLLPGGRIEIGEDSLAAIKREMMEELGYDLSFDFISIQENFIEKVNKTVFQYCFCYKSIYKGNIEKDKFVCLDNKNQYFYWVDIDNLKNYKIYPKSTYELIDSKKITHIVETMEI